MLSRRPARLAALAAVGLFAAACGTTEPGVRMELDTDAALQDYEALAAALGAAESASFKALGGRTPFGSAPAAAIGIVADWDAPDHAGDSRRFAMDLFDRVRAARSASRPAAAPIISEQNRGSTFVYDPESDDYVRDPEREGAPETGVRFITYEVDDQGTPIVTEENGYTDLIDEGDASAEDIVLDLNVVLNGEKVLDYRTSLDVEEDHGRLTVQGFVVGDGVRLDFDIAAEVTQTDAGEELDLDFELRVDQRDFEIIGAVTGIEDDPDGPGSIDITVRHREASLQVDVAGADGELDGTIYLNGDVFATVTGPEDDPTFLGGDGDPLTFGEFLVLRHVFDSLEDVFDFLEDLIDPVDELIVLGIIL